MPKLQSCKVSEFQSNKEAKFQSARVQMGTEIILKEQMIVNDCYQHFFYSAKESKFQSSKVQMGTEIILKEQMIVNDSYQHFFIVPKNQSTKVPEYNWEQRLF